MSAAALNELTHDMLKVTAKRFRCFRSAHSHLNHECGCGVIHDVFYCCKYHHNLLKSNSYLKYDKDSN